MSFFGNTARTTARFALVCLLGTTKSAHAADPPTGLPAAAGRPAPCSPPRAPATPPAPARSTALEMSSFTIRFPELTTEPDRASPYYRPSYKLFPSWAVTADRRHVLNTSEGADGVRADSALVQIMREVRNMRGIAGSTASHGGHGAENFLRAGAFVPSEKPIILNLGCNAGANGGAEQLARDSGKIVIGFKNSVINSIFVDEQGKVIPGSHIDVGKKTEPDAPRAWAFRPIFETDENGATKLDAKLRPIIKDVQKIPVRVDRLLPLLKEGETVDGKNIIGGFGRPARSGVADLRLREAINFNRRLAAADALGNAGHVPSAFAMGMGGLQLTGEGLERMQSAHSGDRLLGAVQAGAGTTFAFAGTGATLYFAGGTVGSGSAALGISGGVGLGGGMTAAGGGLLAVATPVGVAVVVGGVVIVGASIIKDVIDKADRKSPYSSDYHLIGRSMMVAYCHGGPAVRALTPEQRARIFSEALEKQKSARAVAGVDFSGKHAPNVVALVHSPYTVEVKNLNALWQEARKTSTKYRDADSFATFVKDATGVDSKGVAGCRRCHESSPHYVPGFRADMVAK